LEEFYEHPAMADGRVGKCKTCQKRQANERRLRLEQDPEWMAKEAARHRAKAERFRQEGRATVLSKEERREVTRRYRAANPEKARAHGILGHALKAGKLTKSPCEKCGTTVGVHAHHDDYTKPMEVRWLCSAHHREHHRKYR